MSLPQAKKRFGQNFLISTDAIDRILRAADLGEGDRVLEIGPGPGALTSSLRVSRTDLVVIELDRDMAALLQERWPDLKLVQADAMKVDLDALCPGSGWKVVANLPYNVAVPILLRLLDHPQHFSRMVLMFQKEVADRILAAPDDDAVGSLSIQVQARARVERVITLGPGAFRPPPKVDSTVLRFELIAEPDFGGATGDSFDHIVRLAYSKRRKTLLNSLSSGMTREEAALLLQQAGIDPGLRAEVLSLADFRRLAGAYYSISRNASARATA